MQKISTYLYPNRLTVISNLDFETYNTEWKIVYQRTIKIYKGMDNTIEIELKNNDQKRIEIGNTEIKVTILDQANNALFTYTAVSLEDSTQIGLARITIPSIDLADLLPQFLRFVVYQNLSPGVSIVTYNDSNYSAVGTMQLLNGINNTSTMKRYDRFTQETDFNSKRFEDRRVTYASESIPVIYYNAKPPTVKSITAYLDSFIGTLYVEGTDIEVIGHEAFRSPKELFTITFTTAQNGGYAITNLNIQNLTYIRLKYVKIAGKVDYVWINT